MVNLVHDVLIKFKDGSTLEDSLTDNEAFANIKAGNKLYISKCSGNFLFGNQKVSFKGLTSNTLRLLQNDQPDLVIDIISCASVRMDITDIHEYDKITLPIPPKDDDDVSLPPLEPPPIDDEPIGDPQAVTLILSGLRYTPSSDPAFNQVSFRVISRLKNKTVMITNPVLKIQIKNQNNQVENLKDFPLDRTKLNFDQTIVIKTEAKSQIITVDVFMWDGFNPIANKASAAQSFENILPPSDPTDPNVPVQSNSMLKIFGALTTGAVTILLGKEVLKSVSNGKKTKRKKRKN